MVHCVFTMCNKDYSLFLLLTSLQLSCTQSSEMILRYLQHYSLFHACLLATSWLLLVYKLPVICASWPVCSWFKLCVHTHHTLSVLNSNFCSAGAWIILIWVILTALYLPECKTWKSCKSDEQLHILVLNMSRTTAISDDLCSAYTHVPCLMRQCDVGL